MAVRWLAPLLLVLPGAACATAPLATPTPLTRSAGRLESRAAEEGARLRESVLLLLEPGAASAARVSETLARAEERWAACAAAWSALEQHALRLESLLAQLAFDPRGARPAADSWRRMALDLQEREILAPQDCDAVARTLARESDAVGALRAAEAPTAQLAAEMEAALLLEAALLTALRDELDANLRELEAGRERRSEALAALIARAEDLSRMEAAGAGRAPAAELRYWAEDRAERERVLESLADSAARRAAVRAEFDRSAERMRRCARAARAWAEAHAALARALAAGETFTARELEAAVARVDVD